MDEYIIPSIYAAGVLIFMLAGMRYFYGCWPWEQEKTWYVTRDHAIRINLLMELSQRRPTLPNPDLPQFNDNSIPKAKSEDTNHYDRDLTKDKEE